MIRCILAIGLALLCSAGVLAADPFGVEVIREGSGTGMVATIKVTIPPHHHLYADQLRVHSESGVVLRQSGGDQPVLLKDPFSDEIKPSFTNDVVLRYRPVGVIPDVDALKVSYQGCSEEQCFFPKTRVFSPQAAPVIVQGTSGAMNSDEQSWKQSLSGLKPVATAAGFLKSEPFLAFLDKAEGRAESTSPPESALARIKVASLLFSANPLEFFRLYGMWWTLLIILAGGLLLNLTPCVLPMIPINLAIIGAGAQNGTRARGFFLGGAYGFGIALVYGLLGLVVVLTGSQFGLLNSMPWFNATIGLIFVALALAMFDVFAIDMSRFQRVGGGGDGQRGKVITAVTMGGISALLAGACVAPVVIAVLLLSSNLYAQGAGIGLVLPFILGLGMALPWPLAGSGLSFLPKPGAWMTWVKTGFGILILLFAFYYFSLAYQGWWGKKAVVQSVPGVHLITGEDRAAWQAVADEAARTGKPVFVDFWATWCKNCEAMELTTFRAPDVKERLARYVVVKYQAEDLTNQGTRDVADFFGVKGLPTYVVLKAAGSAGP